MIQVGDLVCGKRTENGCEHYGITSSTSICMVTEIDVDEYEDNSGIVILVSSQDYPDYIGDEFRVNLKKMCKIYNKSE